MSKQTVSRDLDIKVEPEVRVKQKRKNAHPVRKHFARSGETQQKCTFCGWLTVENATRMVHHILNRCKNVPDKVRGEISGTMSDAEERQQQSSFTTHNKKAIHNYFESIDNDRKRMCVFCKWTTILNLTRMRHHIMQMCHSVPTEVQQNFLKQEYMEESECDTYCIINVDDGDRKGLQLVSSSSLDANNGREAIEEVVINTDDDYETKDGEESYYEETVLETINDLQSLDVESVGKLDTETELELIVGEPPSEGEDDAIDEADNVEYVNVPEGRYFTLRNNNAEKRPLQAISPKGGESEETAAKTRRLDVKAVASRSCPKKTLSKEEQIRKLRTRFNVSETPKQTIIVKKDNEKPLLLKSNSLPSKNKTHDDGQRLQNKTSIATLQKSPQEAKKPMATSTLFHNTLRQDTT